LKDPDTAMAEQQAEAIVVEPDVNAVLKTLGFL
jgi:hypothetical protein